MLSKPVPLWVFVGGFALTAVAGSVNAVGFLALHHRALAHMSGPLTVLGNELARADLRASLGAVFIVLAFFAGCAASAAIIGDAALKLGRRYGVVLMMESVALTLAWWSLLRGWTGGEWLAAFACGLQNALASTYSGAVLRTTHMTGVVTDLGMALGHWLGRHKVDRRRVVLYTVLLLGFLCGAVAGSFAFGRIGLHALLAPALFTGAIGIAYVLYEQLRRSPRAGSSTTTT